MTTPELRKEELPDVQLTEVELSTSWMSPWIVNTTLFVEWTNNTWQIVSQNYIYAMYKIT